VDVDIQFIALVNVVVKHGSKQVMSRAYSVNVACEMQVDVIHGKNL